MSGQSTSQLELQSDLVDRVELRLPRTEFDTVEEYIEYVLEEVLSHVETVAPEDPGASIDERAVKDQLRALGYADE